MMKQLNINEIKKISLLILQDFIRVCSKLNLNYYLDGGTLLGAVRHNGFIPWDDDIDIVMPRPDYEIFIKKYNKYCSKKYKLKSIENTFFFPFPYAKIYDKSTKLYEHGRNYCNLGLNIDIFPVDAYPNQIENRLQHWDTVIKNFTPFDDNIGYFFLKYSLNPKNLKKNIHIFLVRNGLLRHYGKKIIKNAKSINWDENDYVGMKVCCFYRSKPLFVHKTCYNKIKHIFENKEYCIPEGYDEVLKCYYGDDYMTPPPEKDRNSTHNIKIYYK